MVFVPKVLLVLRSETCDEIVVFLANKWSNAGIGQCTLFFLLIPENLTRETTMALMSFILFDCGNGSAHH